MTKIVMENEDGVKLTRENFEYLNLGNIRFIGIDAWRTGEEWDDLWARSREYIPTLDKLMAEYAVDISVNCAMMHHNGNEVDTENHYLAGRFFKEGTPVPEGFDYHRALCQTADALRIIDAFALPAGIRIAIEPLNRRESNIICSLEEGALLMKEADRSSIRLLVDYYHFMMEKESLETLGALTEDIIHVHFAEPAGRSFPTAEQEAYREFFTVLKEKGYNGRVSIEAYGKEPEKELEKAVFIRKYL